MPNAATADRRAAPAARPAVAGSKARRRRVRGWISDSEWVLAAVALLFLGAFAWPILEPHLAYGWKRVCSVVQLASWVIFLVDYLVRVWPFVE